MADELAEIPYVDLKAQWAEIEKDLAPVIMAVLASGNYINSELTDRFEKVVCNYLGVRHCVALNSGTDALVCGLLAVGVKPGMEVITTSNSFIASTAAIAHIGAVPIFVDVLIDQGMDPEKIEAAITEKTGAIMPVHLTGKVCNMEEISAVAAVAGIPIVEDAAQCIGAKHRGRYGGTFGAVGCFSAHPLKNLNAMGDSGFVVTDNDSYADEIRLMRNHGLIDRNTVKKFGYVSRMDALQAAILGWKVENYLESVNKRRRSNAIIYANRLPKETIKPFEDPSDYSVFHTYVIQTNRRDSLKEYLAARGVGTAIHYPIPIHKQPAYVNRYGKTLRFPLSVTEKQASEIISLPIHQNLKIGSIIYIAEQISRFFRKKI